MKKWSVENPILVVVYISCFFLILVTTIKGKIDSCATTVLFSALFVEEQCKDNKNTIKSILYAFFLVLSIIIVIIY